MELENSQRFKERKSNTFVSNPSIANVFIILLNFERAFQM